MTADEPESSPAMTIELARFRVREGAEDRLVAERPEMVAALRRRFPGCLAAYLTRGDDGEWLDVILWRSRAEAEESAREVNSVPEVAAWFRHIAESGGLRHVEVVSAWTDSRPVE
ncbi:antibiotic biosynthesis monooxygenase [Nonomuraea fuscirosea]|uniref:Antibiotic biosynthesis monooxygenase n=1 Tax=Nonomuraea fuscirosea TaxID=1291556 RepID=A0A2T0N2N8_9ACTN|nr:antibiotic biosynthesis monooxygenase [Nonomuraea fuscirosea]PRX66215.1 antibiotic biosynthesis monooxygenase [Nonomuraea fuscirosea]